jgi:hypothetical protein
MTEHRWPETIWNTTQLGFVIGLDPQFFDPEQAIAKVIQDLWNNTSRHPKIPKFRMSYTTPSINTNDRQLRTKAYAIETEKSNRMEMLRFVKQAYKDTGLLSRSKCAVSYQKYSPKQSECKQPFSHHTELSS